MSNPWENIKHFSPEEFDSEGSPGSGVNMNIAFIELLDKIRDIAGVPLSINSGYRTVEHNAAVGGKSDSAHLKGVACDIRVDNSGDRYRLISAIISVGIVRFGIGGDFIHLDMDYTLPQKVCWLYPNGVAR
jgi:zinc D-Ala-D-Ala carboxypeptidase